LTFIILKIATPIQLYLSAFEILPIKLPLFGDDAGTVPQKDTQLEDPCPVATGELFAAD
jgi:hypothetical protein